MKKIYALGFGVLAALGLNAQVTVTLKVDVTDYVAAGNTVATGGIRVGGNFTDYMATNANGDTIANWGPADPTAAMTDEGNNIWSIMVTYPAEVMGDTQQFKFVNGDWGMNEGTDTNAIATDGCGIDDGSGNINRTVEIPTEGLTLEYCWDRCAKCDGSDALTGLEETAVETFSVAPNPAVDYARFTYSLSSSEKISLKLYNLLGAEVATVVNETKGAGIYTVDANVANLNSGVYLYVLRAGDSVTQGKIVKQ